jgi:hypothetical protein
MMRQKRALSSIDSALSWAFDVYFAEIAAGRWQSALLMSKSPASDRRDAAPIVMRLSVGAMANTFFTIGHSIRTIVEFADLLQESGVNFVVDVRSIPRSRTHPQFNRPAEIVPWRHSP